MRLDVLRVDVEARLVGGDRLAVLAVVLVGHSEPERGFGEGGVDLERLAERLDGRREVAFFVVRPSAIELVGGCLARAELAVVVGDESVSADATTGQEPSDGLPQV